MHSRKNSFETQNFALLTYLFVCFILLPYISLCFFLRFRFFLPVAPVAPISAREDLLDTPVFGHRSAVADRFSYSPAGPGALEGLRLIYRRRITPCEAGMRSKNQDEWRGVI